MSFRTNCISNFDETVGLFIEHFERLGYTFPRIDVNQETTETFYDKFTMYDENDNVITPSHEVFDIVQEKTIRQILEGHRNIRLENSDKYVLPDYPHASEEKRQEYITYRQQLRDFMNTLTFVIPENGFIEYDDITWPEEPTP